MLFTKVSIPFLCQFLVNKYPVLFKKKGGNSIKFYSDKCNNFQNDIECILSLWGMNNQFTFINFNLSIQNIKKITFFSALVLIVSQGFCQLIVTPNSVAATLAQDIAGNGVTITNPQLNCGPNASGVFTYTGTDLGMTGGILLTTGTATDVANPGTYFCDVANGNMFSDPNLTNISPLATNDVCILQFDFLPICSNLSITFVFGSEEYPTFVNSQYNDAFGIFLTGPNPSGVYYTGQNIGVLPNTTPVSINNVNAGLNSTYFHDNYTTPNNDIAYDGYTIPITSVTQVYPCSTYHMKIAIADAGDEYYDSGVFIGSNAVSCQNAPTVAASSTPVSCGGTNGTAAATVTNYTGTVTYHWFPGGQTTATISGQGAGVYTCTVTYNSGCSSTSTETVTTTINTTGSNLVLSTSTQSATCPSTHNGSATVNISGGTGPYTTSWATNPVQTGTTAINLGTGTYNVLVTDQNGCIATSSVAIGAANNNGFQTSSIQLCGTQTVLVAPTGSNYQWYSPLNASIAGATSANYSATGISNGQHYAVAYLDNSTGCRDSMEIQISTWNLTFSQFTSAPCNGGSNGSISFTPTGQNTFTTFSVQTVNTTTINTTSVETVPNLDVNNIPAGTYTVTLNSTSNVGCSYTYTFTLLNNQLPVPVIDTVKGCNLDTIKLNSLVPNSTNNWYTSNLSSLGTFTTSPLLLYPVPYSGLNINQNGALYIDTIYSAAGCRSIYKAFVRQSSFNVNSSVLQTLRCHNDSNGKLRINIIRENNGPINQPYHLNWIYPSPYSSPSGIIAGSAPPITSTETNLHPGTYTCVIRAGNCAYTQTVVLVNPPELTPDTITAFFCPKDSLAMVIAKPGYTLYQWYFNNVAVTPGQNPNYNNDSIEVLTPDVAGYTLTYHRSGCVDSAKTRLDYPSYNVFNPNETVNIFTPNGDHLNEAFYPFYDKNYSQQKIANQVDTYDLKVFDRWGTLVYETTDYTKPWSGKSKSGDMVADGSYFWIVKFKSNCASKAGLISKQGYVQLLK